MWNKLFVLVLVVLTVSFQEGIVSCQNSIDVEDALKQSGDEVLEIRDQSNMKVTDIEKALKEKCEKRGAPNAFELLKDEPHRAKKCINKYINATTIEEELETLQKTDSFEKFAKYCNKWPLIYGCFDNFTLYLRQCMDNKEEKSFNKTIDIIKKMKDFICFLDGERLAHVQHGKNFICKEIAIINVGSAWFEHRIVKSPSNFQVYTACFQKQCNWLTDNIHGLEWDQTGGEILEYTHLSECIRNSVDFNCVYVKGDQKKKWLKSIIANAM